jgi:hypothetical protein
MSQKENSITNPDTLEKILIGIILGSPILRYFIFKGDTDITAIFLVVPVIAMLILIALYIKQTPRNLFSIVLLGLSGWPLSYGMSALDIPFYSIFTFVDIAADLLAGILFLRHSFKMTTEFKNFQLIPFLLGFFLILMPPLMTALVMSGKEAEGGIMQLYHFGTCFLIGTIMYNENLWEQYNPTQRKTMIVILLISLTVVIKLTSKMMV